MNDSPLTVSSVHSNTRDSSLKDSFIWSVSEVQTFMSVSYRPNLNSRVHVIVDVIIFQNSMAIVIEVDPDL